MGAFPEVDIPAISNAGETGPITELAKLADRGGFSVHITVLAGGQIISGVTVSEAVFRDDMLESLSAGAQKMSNTQDREAALQSVAEMSKAWDPKPDDEPAFIHIRGTLVDLPSEPTLWRVSIAGVRGHTMGSVTRK